MPKSQVLNGPPWADPLCEDPIHVWFELSYANYLVIPRTLLQSCTRATQLALCEALEKVREEEQENMPGSWPVAAKIEVKLRDVVTGHYIVDPLADYERGRRRLWQRNERVVPPSRGADQVRADRDALLTLCKDALIALNAHAVAFKTQEALERGIANAEANL